MSMRVWRNGGGSAPAGARTMSIAPLPSLQKTNKKKTILIPFFPCTIDWSIDWLIDSTTTIPSQNHRRGKKKKRRKKTTRDAAPCCYATLDRPSPSPILVCWLAPIHPNFSSPTFMATSVQQDYVCFAPPSPLVWFLTLKPMQTHFIDGLGSDYYWHAAIRLKSQTL